MEAFVVNLQDVLQLSKAYRGSTQVATFVIDNSGKQVVSSGAETVPKETAGFCRIIHNDASREAECRRTHLYGGYQAERFGEAYVYFCPFGLVHWAAPVLQDYQIMYTLIAGPVLMSTPENALVDEILSKNGLNGQEICLLRKALNGVKYLPPIAVNDMATLLMAVAGSASRQSEEVSRDRQAYSDQQAAIAEVLQQIKTGSGQQPAYPIEKEKELVLKIRLGDKPGAQELLNEIFGYIFFSQGNEVETIKTRVIELVVVLSRAAMEGGADNEVIFGLNYHYLREVNGLQTVDELAFWLSKVMARFTDSVFNLTNVKNSDILYKAVAYMRENYAQEIKLEKLARHVNLSPTYFSKIFNEGMHCNFSNYLNVLRVENSKKYLLNEEIPLVEVAGLVGFQDQSYYTKVFKRIINISPGEFRKSRGLIPRFPG